ncbi:recombinase family protein [Kitasatospora sp. NPDC048365]|uniref:recombinase family protein n=1 Tax=Kitasatospora sp. NPDC048365 TaxID=3364050 RepID=UPI0037193FB7
MDDCHGPGGGRLRHARDPCAEEPWETYSSKRKTAPSNHWNASSVGKILRSPATMGFKLVGRLVKARKLARDAKGLPIRMAKPLFSEEEWAAIQAAMDERSVTRERSNGAAPWLGVVHCDRCGDRLYRQERPPSSPRPVRRA